jgi:hypothetical protein
MKKLFFTLMVMTMALPSFSFATTNSTVCGTNYTVPVVAASYSDDDEIKNLYDSLASGILLTWNMINDSDFAGYKVVISKNDSTPSYPSNGYLYFINDKNTTAQLINNNNDYNNGDFGSYLAIGENYYFSVTAVYTCNGSTTYVPGNVLYMTYRGGLSLIDSSQYLNIVDTKITNTSNTTARVWWKAGIGSEGQYRYSKNQSELSSLAWRSDGVSNDPNITENMFASQVDLTNLESNTTYIIQLRKSFGSGGSGSNITYGPVKDLSFISGSLGVHSANLDVVDTRVDLIKSDSARVYWRSTIAAEGYFRYATSLDALATQAWSSIGVSNGPAVTGNMTGSMVSLFLLQPNTKYYVEVKKAGGTEGNSGYVYGNPTIINFTTNSPGVEGTYVADLNIAKTRVDQIKTTSARVYWQVVNMSSDGYYRYATSTDALAGLPWVNTGVLNGPEATGNYNASMVTLNNLQPFTKYYIEVKSVAGIAGEVSYRYGNPTTINFTTLSGNGNNKIKVCHVVGNGKTNTLEISESALAAHLAHGDKEGACLQPLIDNNPGVVKPGVKVDAGLVNRVRGRILLQVEDLGQAYWVKPKTGAKVFIKDGSSAYEIMRFSGLGITSADLAKVPVGDIASGVSNAKAVYDSALAKNVSGQILLDVQNHGEAWYVNPVDGKRYYMKDGAAAYQIMRNLSLGINNDNLNKIPDVQQ